MNSLSSAIIIMMLLSPNVAHPASFSPTYNLEKKIAYQQGQFGGLYAYCGNAQDKAVIGGSLANWREETFMGYRGTAEEKDGLMKAFDQAARDVKADPSGCSNWVKQAAATWRSIARLAAYGTADTKPVALR